jgi:hypothetical protein
MNPTASYLYGSRQFTSWALLNFVKLLYYQLFYYPGSAFRISKSPWNHANHFYSMSDARESLKQ